MAELSVWDVLKTPVITEKSVLLKEASTVTPEEVEKGAEPKEQILSFKVARQASKDDIRRAVEEIFSVKVSKIRTVNYEGKIKKRGRHEGRRASWKKAYVTLQKGEPIVDYAEAI
jgi:large subunit ribosomal protein L23